MRIFLARNVPKEHNPYLYNCVYGKIGFINVVSVKVVVFKNLTTTLMRELVYIGSQTTAAATGGQSSANYTSRLANAHERKRKGFAEGKIRWGARCLR